MSYHLVDDQLFQNRKFKALMRRGLEGDADAWGAGLLWVMAGSAIKAGYGDGTLSTYDLFSLVPDPSAAPRLAAVLVGAGLWHDAAHPCPYGRCPVPDSHQYVFHDWREYHKKTGEEERNARALQTERNDSRLKAEVWQRDRLPHGPGAPDVALCAYCGKPVSRAVTKGDEGAEVDHVIPKPLGVDNLVVSHRRCNRSKGQRTPAAAGLTLHLTDAHRTALELREKCSPPDGAAGLLAEMLAREPWPLDADGVLFDDDVSRSHPEGSAGREKGHGSHPEGFAEPPVASETMSRTAARGPAAPARGAQEPPGRPDPAPRCPGRSLPFSGPQESDGSPADASAPSSDIPVPSAEDRRDLAGRRASDDSTDLALAAIGTAEGSRAPARAHALTGARGPAWHGTAGHGTASAGNGAASPGRRRRRRRRAKKKPRTTATCPIHDDRLPCRLCQEGLP